MSGLVFNELAEPAAPLARTQLSWLRAKNRPRRFAFRPARAEQCGCGKTPQLRRRPTGADSAVASPTPPALPVQPGRGALASSVEKFTDLSAWLDDDRVGEIFRKTRAPYER